MIDSVVFIIRHPTLSAHFGCIPHATLLSKATDTSKTFIVLKVSILENPDWFYPKAYNLPFVHTKFQSTASNGLVSISFWNLRKFGEILLKNCIFKDIFINELIYFCESRAKLNRISIFRWYFTLVLNCYGFFTVFRKKICLYQQILWQKPCSTLKKSEKNSIFP